MGLGTNQRFCQGMGGHMDVQTYVWTDIWNFFPFYRTFRAAAQKGAAISLPQVGMRLRNINPANPAEKKIGFDLELGLRH